MTGDARVRHCGACDRDVRNVATMTPAEIDAMLAAPGPLPCMRIVQYPDGSLMAARVETKRGFLRHASVALTTVMLAATSSLAKAHPAIADNTAVLQGVIVDPDGTPIPHAVVKLTQDGHRVTSSETDKNGIFTLSAAPGKFVIDALAPGFANSLQRRVDLVKGARRLADPIRLNVVALMGEVVVVEKPLKTRKLSAKLNPPAVSKNPAEQGPSD